MSNLKFSGIPIKPPQGDAQRILEPDALAVKDCC